MTQSPSNFRALLHFRFAGKIGIGLVTLCLAKAAISAPEASSARATKPRLRGPAISVIAVPTKVSAGGSAQFVVRTSTVNPIGDLTVNYSMSGTAVPGQDYSSSALSGSVTIPAGASGAILTINALGSSSRTGRTATLRLQSGAGYKVATPSRSSVTILPGSIPSPTPAPTPIASPTPNPSPAPTATPVANPTPRPTPQQEIWIAIRTDGLPGTGTQADPFDGSAPEKFDAVLASYRSVFNLGVHLMGAGPFRTDTRHTWNIRPGWVISGDGMYSTTLQVVGSLAGMPFGVYAISSDPNMVTDNATVRDLTIDCNWPGIGSTAPDGQNREKDSGATAVIMHGSNNLLERVRCINSYGSWANKKEQFAMFLTAPKTAEGTNNIIRDCRAEMPQGNYGNPFALAGYDTQYFITNSKVLGCTAVGVNNGKREGFTSGGVNLAQIKNCEVDGNTFIDCEGAAYLDVGTIDGLRITNNTVIRGWQGVGLVSVCNKQNITISGNSFNIQNRPTTGASYGIVIGTGPENLSITNSNVSISNNTISFDTSGQGLLSFWGIATSLLNTATISDNTIGVVYPLANNAVGFNVILTNNRMSDGSVIIWRPY
jgi:hypothetical protein